MPNIKSTPSPGFGPPSGGGTGAGVSFVTVTAPLTGGGTGAVTIGLDTSGFGDVFKGLPNQFTATNVFKSAVQVVGRLYGGGTLSLDGSSAGGTAQLQLLGPQRLILASDPIYGSGTALPKFRYVTSGELAGVVAQGSIVTSGNLFTDLQVTGTLRVYGPLDLTGNFMLGDQSRSLGQAGDAFDIVGSGTFTGSTYFGANLPTDTMQIAVPVTFVGGPLFLTGGAFYHGFVATGPGRYVTSGELTTGGVGTGDAIRGADNYWTGTNVWAGTMVASGRTTTPTGGTDNQFRAMQHLAPTADSSAEHRSIDEVLIIASGTWNNFVTLTGLAVQRSTFLHEGGGRVTTVYGHDIFAGVSTSRSLVNSPALSNSGVIDNVIGLRSTVLSRSATATAPAGQWSAGVFAVDHFGQHHIPIVQVANLDYAQANSTGAAVPTVGSLTVLTLNETTLNGLVGTGTICSIDGWTNIAQTFLAPPEQLRLNSSSVSPSIGIRQRGTQTNRLQGATTVGADADPGSSVLLVSGQTLFYGPLYTYGTIYPQGNITGQNAAATWATPGDFTANTIGANFALLGPTTIIGDLQVSGTTADPSVTETIFYDTYVRFGQGLGNTPVQQFGGKALPGGSAFSYSLAGSGVLKGYIQAWGGFLDIQEPVVVNGADLQISGTTIAYGTFYPHGNITAVGTPTWSTAGTISANSIGANSALLGPTAIVGDVQLSGMTLVYGDISGRSAATTWSTPGTITTNVIGANVATLGPTSIQGDTQLSGTVIHYPNTGDRVVFGATSHGLIVQGPTANPQLGTDAGNAVYIIGSGVWRGAALFSTNLATDTVNIGPPLITVGDVQLSGATTAYGTIRPQGVVTGAVSILGDIQVSGTTADPSATEMLFYDTYVRFGQGVGNTPVQQFGGKALPGGSAYSYSLTGSGLFTGYTLFQGGVLDAIEPVSLRADVQLSGTSSLAYSPIYSRNVGASASRYVVSGELAGVIDRNMSILTVTGVQRQAFYSYTVPANTLGTSRGLRLSVIGAMRNRSGSTGAAAYLGYYGSTFLFSGTGPSLANQTPDYGFELSMVLMASGTAQQRAFTKIITTPASTSLATSGVLLATTFMTASLAANLFAREDSTQSANLVLYAENQGTGGNFQLIKHAAILELL